MGASVQWITTTLQTAESKNIRDITISLFYPFPETIRGAVCQEWEDLDRVLVQFWTSYSIRPQVMYAGRQGVKDLRDDVPSLLPELTRRGLVDLVEVALL